MSAYLDKAAEQLAKADLHMPGSPIYEQHMELAARYERLACIEQGLLPAGLAEQEG